MKKNIHSEDMMTQTINVTPKWESLVPVLLHIAQNTRSQEALACASEELIKMARAADLWNAHCEERKGLDMGT